MNSLFLSLSHSAMYLNNKIEETILKCMILTVRNRVYSQTYLQVILFPFIGLIHKHYHTLLDKFLHYHAVDYYTSKLILEKTSQKSVWLLCAYILHYLKCYLFCNSVLESIT